MFPLPEFNVSLSNDEKPIRGHNIDHKKFQRKVYEEFHRDNILADVFMRSTQENPYTRHVNNSIELCQSLKEEARQRFLEDKRRQQLRENNHELKQLEYQLRSAYVNKAISFQIFEKEALKRQEKAKEKEINRQLDQAHQRFEEVARNAEQKKHERREAFKAGIQDQLEFSKSKRQIRYEALLKEKEEVMEFIRRNKELDRKEQQEAINRRNKAKAEMVQYKADEEAFKSAQEAANQEEDDRILKIIEAREREVARKNEEKRQERIRKQEIGERIGQTLYDKQIQELKAHENLTELLIDEFQAKLDMEERARLEKEMQKRKAAFQQHAYEMENKELKKLAAKKLEEDFYREQMCILAERDKLDQLDNELRQKKKLEHRQALQQAFNDKKRLKAKRTNLSLSLHQKDVREAERIQQFVEQERARMISEHAESLAGFWGPGLLRASEAHLVSDLSNK